MKPKVLIVFGTRPEAIKMAPVIWAFQKVKEQVDLDVCVTAQHREMLDQVLNRFEIRPNFDLNLMRPNQDLYDITSGVLCGLKQVLRSSQPNVILVHGDTTTSVAAALAAFYQKIPVGHVEAGLRTKDIYNPWPEEMNRQITSRIAIHHFAPTELSKINLVSEGVSGSSIILTGNTGIDALYWVINKIKQSQKFKQDLLDNLNLHSINNSQIGAWETGERRMILITAHRRENSGEGFDNISRGVFRLALDNPSVDFVYPMHMSPAVRSAIQKSFSSINGKIQPPKNIHLVEPVDYFPFVYLMKLSTLILTDSGGIQEEAPSLGKNVLVLRDTTERPEAVQGGLVKLIGTNADKIFDETSKILLSSRFKSDDTVGDNPYGDGLAAERIVSEIVKKYSNN